jgi:hypothetical protein
MSVAALGAAHRNVRFHSNSAIALEDVRCLSDISLSAVQNVANGPSQHFAATQQSVALGEYRPSRLAKKLHFPSKLTFRRCWFALTSPYTHLFHDAAHMAWTCMCSSGHLELTLDYEIMRSGLAAHNPELLSDWFLLIAKKINELSMRVIYPLSQV